MKSYLIRIDKNEEIRKLCLKPMVISDGLTSISISKPDDFLICDCCNAMVDISLPLSLQIKKPEELKKIDVNVGYALIDVVDGKEFINRVVCEDCRIKYFSKLKIQAYSLTQLKELEEKLKGFSDG